MSIVDLVCATEVEEFFYEDSDTPLPEGEPIGVDIIYKHEVKLVLFDNIYWSPRNEESE